MDVLNEVKHENFHDPGGFPTFGYMASIIVIYLLFVYQIGPRLMENRAPFRLKHFMSFYNVIQVASCLYLITKIWNLTSWTVFDFSKCLLYLPNTPERREYLDITYKTFFLKVFELTDTVIFVLRKKKNQITYLHVFHHSSTITLVYLISHYFSGNGVLYPIYLNSWVHVVMYTYYFFANICSSEVIRKYILIKKSITIMQMIQFCFILYQAAVMWQNCGVHMGLRIYYCSVVSAIFYGFYDFYKKAYIQNQKNKLNASK